ncbi:unnamed protein product [Caenorhabditis angaria]|uniref:Uncharacterized protein n=1 Tax=Caenorhabditis angaria TaxID=860376 RepID=A0A9P1I2X8_9PELO|nr:unnamed protein product [Caenorhabditis angaria]
MGKRRKNGIYDHFACERCGKTRKLNEGSKISRYRKSIPEILGVIEMLCSDCDTLAITSEMKCSKTVVNKIKYTIYDAALADECFDKFSRFNKCIEYLKI